MMQHPGFGPVAAGGQTGHVAAVNPQLAQQQAASFPATAPAPALPRNEELTTPPPSPFGGGGGGGGLGGLGDHDPEVHALRRRIEQLQTELRVYRANKVGHDAARRMEQLEQELSAAEADRDGLKARLGQVSTGENAQGPVNRAIGLATSTAETAASLNDVLSAMRIEVMAAEGALDQYAQALPRASYELIRQSLRDAAGHCDEARTILRKLRE
jgi:hypothetical protein